MAIIKCLKAQDHVVLGALYLLPRGLFPCGLESMIATSGVWLSLKEGEENEDNCTVTLITCDCANNCPCRL